MQDKGPYRFGEKLRSVRETKGLTLKEVATAAGVSESLVSQIERNRISPAIDTLVEILRVLDLDIEYIFADLKRDREVLVTRRTERRRLVTENAVYELVSKTVSKGGEGDEHGIEAYILHLPAGAARGNQEYGHRGRELGLVEEGTAEFRLGNEVWTLDEGDSVSFDSSVPHRLTNIGPGPLRAFWIVSPPKGLHL